MKPNTTLTIAALSFGLLAGCATTPSFETFGEFLDGAADDAREAIADCKALSKDEGELVDCLNSFADTVKTSGQAAANAVEQICAEIEAQGGNCKGVGE